MGPAVLLKLLAIVCFCIVSFSRPTASEELTIKNETSKSTNADKTRNTGMAKINRLKFEVMKTTESVLSYSEYISRRMSVKMSHYQQVCRKLIRRSHKEKLQTLLERVSFAKSDDNKIKDCYSSAEKKMHQQIQDLSSSNCSAIDMMPINEFIDEIKTMTKIGDNIIGYLDDVIFHCCSKDCAQFYDCINSKILPANDRVRIYRHKFKQLRHDGFSVKNNHTHFQCYGQRAVQILKTEIEQIYSNATQCVLSFMAKV